VEMRRRLRRSRDRALVLFSLLYYSRSLGVFDEYLGLVARPFTHHTLCMLMPDSKLKIHFATQMIPIYRTTGMEKEK